MSLLKASFKWDDYGEIIRPEEYIIADAVVPQMDKVGKAIGVLTKEEEGGFADEDDEPMPLMPLVMEEWPTKCISEIRKIEVLFSLNTIRCIH